MGNKEKYTLLYTSAKEITDSLESQIQTFKKNPNRVVNKKTFRKRIQELDTAKSTFDNLLKQIEEFKQTEKTKEVIDNLSKTFFEYSEILREILNNRLDETIIIYTESEAEEEEKEDRERESESESENKNDDTETKMAVFNYETAMKLPVLRETGPVEIRDFLNNVEAYYEFLDNASKTNLIAFVIKTKIQGRPKTKIGNKTAETFAQLRQLVINDCGASETYESIKTKLTAKTQGYDTLEQFAETINGLTEQLAACVIKKQNAVGEAQTAIREMSKIEGLTSFKKGLKNELKVVVEASRPTTIEEALQVASAAESTASSSSTQAVFHIKCYGCGQEGHRKTECHKNYTGRNFTPMNYSNVGRQNFQRGGFQNSRGFGNSHGFQGERQDFYRNQQNNRWNQQNDPSRQGREAFQNNRNYNAQNGQYRNTSGNQQGNPSRRNDQNFNNRRAQNGHRTGSGRIFFSNSGNEQNPQTETGNSPLGEAGATR
jgi:hypothetical protein